MNYNIVHWLEARPIYQNIDDKSFNSSPPSVPCMCRWTGSSLIQVMACRLFSTKPLPEPMLTFSQLDPLEQSSVKFESKHKIFIDQNAFEKVCKMVAILSKGRWVKILSSGWETSARHIIVGIPVSRIHVCLMHDPLSRYTLCDKNCSYHFQ